MRLHRRRDPAPAAAEVEPALLLQEFVERDHRLVICLRCLINEQQDYCALGLRHCPWLRGPTTPERRASPR